MFYKLWEEKVQLFTNVFTEIVLKSVKIAFKGRVALKRERRDGKKKPQNRVLLSLEFQEREEKV